jgi:hypothetical protein
MTISFNHTILAYLLALKDFSDALDETERSKLKDAWEQYKDVSKQYKIQPKAWDDYIEPDIVKIVQGNSLLNQFYQQYKDALDTIGEIPDDLLPTRDEINQLTKDEATVVYKGFEDNSPPPDVNKHIENAFIVVGQSETPEETVKKLSSIGKLKQFLNQLNQPI